MQFARGLISILLLLTYSLEFAHNLVPHCHEHHALALAGIQEKACTHNHDQHRVDNQDTQGFFSILKSFLGEMEASALDCSIEHCFSINSKSSSADKISKIKLLVLLFPNLLEIIQEDVATHYDTSVNLAFSSPPLEHTPLRGPPSFTC